MAVKIDDKIIEYVGILAKLNLSEEEKKKAGEDMSRMLEYIDVRMRLQTGISPGRCCPMRPGRRISSIRCRVR